MPRLITTSDPTCSRHDESPSLPSRRTFRPGSTISQAPDPVCQRVGLDGVMQVGSEKGLPPRKVEGRRGSPVVPGGRCVSGEEKGVERLVGPRQGPAEGQRWLVEGRPALVGTRQSVGVHGHGSRSLFRVARPAHPRDRSRSPNAA